MASMGACKSCRSDFPKRGDPDATRASTQPVADNAWLVRTVRPLAASLPDTRCPRRHAMDAYIAHVRRL